jgi:hypothetical protein
MKIARIAFMLLLLLGFGATSDAQVSIGVTIGPPPPPHVVRVLPRRPGPGFVWVGGYWYPASNHYYWHNGYWTRPPYRGAHWVGPRYHRGRYYRGHWDGRRG